MRLTREKRFPVGREITLAELERDPYPSFERLRQHEPISWIAALNMWYVVGYEDVRTALLDTSRLTTVSTQSTILDTFGSHILTTEGALHERYRQALRPPFTPAFIRTHLEAAIATAAAELIDEFKKQGQADARLNFASRLPIQVILLVCGLPAEAEAQMRRWYDSFEAALANFTGDAEVRAAARRSVVEFHALLDTAINSTTGANDNSLLARLVHAPEGERLSNDEIKRNLSIVFFGGISTVEALLLNSLWALFEHPDVMQRVLSDLTLLPQLIEETLRWLSPVQSATRHVIAPFEWQGIEFAPHDTVNCMLGAANRDPTVFADPHRFDLDRANSRRHLGFATGTHACLGSHLAKTEVRIGLEALLKLRNLRPERALTEPPSGYEFRQSRRLTLSWDRSVPDPSPADTTLSRIPTAKSRESCDKIRVTHSSGDFDVQRKQMKIKEVRIHRFGGPEVLELDHLEPSQPDALQVLVRVKAASINPVDFKIRNGQYPAVKEDRLPYTLGRDVSGTIEKCGAQATKFNIGDEVLGMVGIAGGGYAEEAVLDQAALARKPTTIDHVHAAAIPLAGTTAWQGLFRHGQLQKGQSVLIHGGSGGVGHFAVQFAKAKGARVLTTVSTDNVEFARGLGADVVIDYKTQRFEDHAQDLDMVFDLIDGETRERSWKLLKRGGVLVSTLTVPSQDSARQYGVRALRYTVEANGSDLAEMVDLVASGKVKPHVQRTFRLEQATAAMGEVEHGSSVGKIVLSLM